MKIIIIQLIFTVVTFIVTLLCMLIPLRIYPREGTIHVNTKSQRIMAFCNCVSGGVFLGVCFIGLIPFCRDKFAASFAMKGMEVPYPFSELTVVLGFFLVLVIEQSIQVCQNKRKDEDEVGEMLKLPNEYLVYPSDSLSSEDTENEEDGSELGTLGVLSPGANRDRVTVPTGNNRPHLDINGKLQDVESEASDTTALILGEGDHMSLKTETRHRRRHNSHGHSHHSHGGGHGHSHAIDIFNQNSGLRCAVLLIALSIHALFEGMAVGLQDEMGKLINLFIGVLVHECLVSFAMGISLAKQRLKISTIVKLSLLLCSMIPVGIVLGLAIGIVQNFAGSITSAVLQAMAAGTFIYVIFLEILPAEINEPRDRLLKVFFLFFGFILIACLQVATGHEH